MTLSHQAAEAIIARIWHRDFTMPELALIIAKVTGCDAMAAPSELVRLLSEGLDLCVRARSLDTLQVPEDVLTRSGTVALWIEDQYQKELANWEEKTRALLSRLQPQAPTNRNPDA